MKTLFIIGLMSGTSMDGIDVSLMKTDGITSKNIGDSFIYPYSYHTQMLIDKLNTYSVDKMINNKHLLNKLSISITQDHAKASFLFISRIFYKIDLIGFHGQTIYHNPQKKISLQIGDPQLLSNITNIKVVSNFRDNDITMGGQGAPLAPIYHKHIAEKNKFTYPNCFLNIGGVSNISYCDETFFLGFDTGPGNGLIDIFIKKRTGQPFDSLGSLAKSGIANKKLIQFILEDTFYHQLPPKSLDKLYFEKIFSLKEFIKLSLPDAIATLSQLTIESILLSLNLLPKEPKLMIVCGGGRKNLYFIENLKKYCAFKIVTAEEINIEGDFMESELVAFISARCFNQLPITFPTTTGVSSPLLGGKVYTPII